jgi:hypothetical protein
MLAGQRYGALLAACSGSGPAPPPALKGDERALADAVLGFCAAIMVQYLLRPMFIQQAAEASKGAGGHPDGLFKSMTQQLSLSAQQVRGVCAAAAMYEHLSRPLLEKQARLRGQLAALSTQSCAWVPTHSGSCQQGQQQPPEQGRHPTLVGHLATLEGHHPLQRVCDELEQLEHVLTWYHACQWSHVMGLLSVRQVRAWALGRWAFWGRSVFLVGLFVCAWMLCMGVSWWAVGSP